MTFNAYWKRLIDANPALADGENRMRISVAAFRLALSRAYEAGSAGAMEEAADELRGGDDDNQPNISMPDFLRDLFGGAK